MEAGVKGPEPTLIGLLTTPTSAVGDGSPFNSLPFHTGNTSVWR